MLGRTLKTLGFLTDRGGSIFMSKGKGGTVVSFVVIEGFWSRPGIAENFEEIGREIAPSVGGFPIKVRLMNSKREIKKEMNVGKWIVGTKDEIYYLGGATEADAKVLAQALQTAGFFQDKGVSVLLSKGDSTVLSFVVNEDSAKDPKYVAAFETLIREVASSVGGLPIKGRLINSALETKKEVAVQ